MKILKKISKYSLIAALFITPIFALADNYCPPGAICNPFSGGNNLMTLITTILNNIIMPIAAVAVVLWIVWAGLTYVMANGKPAEIQKAHERLLWALVGGGILLGAAG